ncbi:MAG: hypothetical protein K0S47_2605 [Herbinix sp.]|jgi:hypothetical protein|nr:hypothetical protein [Herbinix sp.]
MYEDEIKRKIRNLKKLEMKIRFGVKKLIWVEFFDLNGNGRKHDR